MTSLFEIQYTIIIEGNTLKKYPKANPTYTYGDLYTSVHVYIKQQKNNFLVPTEKEPILTHLLCVV